MRGQGAPKVHPNERVVDMSGHIKTTLSLGLGLWLLGQFLKALGGTTVGLEGEFKQAKTLTFEFDDPYFDSWRRRTWKSSWRGRTSTPGP